MQGEVVVGSYFSAASQWIPGVIRDYLSAYPNVRIHLRQAGVGANDALAARGWQGNAVLPFDPPQAVELGCALPSLRDASPATRKFVTFLQTHAPDLRRYINEASAQ